MTPQIEKLIADNIEIINLHMKTIEENDALYCQEIQKEEKIKTDIMSYEFFAYIYNADLRTIMDRK